MLKRRGRLLLLILTIIGAGGLLAPPASAAILTNRSIVLSSYTPSATVSNDFKFDIPSTTDIGSIKFEYCANSPSFYSACVAPAGLDVSSATLTSETGNPGFTINSAAGSSNRIVLSRTAAPGVVAASEYVFSGVVSPSAPGEAVFVKISTHNAQDASDANIDTGAVAFATQNIFNVDAYVPPFLQLCVGVTVAPNCSSIVGDSIDLGILSNVTANKGQSQYSVATNDPQGYVVFALGTTMTSGNNIIPSLSLPTASIPGTGQFGINLRANLVPPIGQEPVVLDTNSNGTPTPNYNIPNRFIFNDGDSISSSPIPSNYNRMTVSYLVNVPKAQPPGVYSTTITYVATVQF